MLKVDFSRPPLYTPPSPVKRRYSEKYAPHLILKNIKCISSFAHCNVAIDHDGGLWTWGYDSASCHGAIVSYDSPPPVLYPPRKRLDNVISASVGGDCTYAITADGDLWRLGSIIDSLKPEKILDEVTSICASDGVTLCIRKDSSLWGWGVNTGLFPTNQEIIQMPVHIVDGVLQASCNAHTIMAITIDHVLWGWGIDITDKTISTPMPLMANMAYQSLPKFTCAYALAVTRDGDLYSFGISNYGSMTTWKDRIDSSLPIKVLSGVDKVWAGHGVSFVRLKNGNLLSSGDNGGGQCGIGKYSAPFHKPAFVMQDVKEAAVGWHHAMALQENGDLWIWGGNYEDRGMLPSDPS